MRYRALGTTGWRLSAVGLGCWGIGGQWRELTDHQAVQTVEAAFDRGVNLFDTADAYGIPIGRSETLIGRALRNRRDQVYVATKVGNWARRLGSPLPFSHPEHIVLCCDASLYRLRTDYIDLYQCHIGSPDDPDIFLEAFHRLRTEGKIREFGVSTNDVNVLRRFNRDSDCAACQTEYSILHRQPERDLFPYAQEAGIGVLVRGPLAQGVLTGKFDESTRFADPVRGKWNDGDGRADYLRRIERTRSCAFLARSTATLSQAALAFALSHPAVSSVIPGATSASQAVENAAAAEIDLEVDDLDRVRAITDS